MCNKAIIIYPLRCTAGPCKLLEFTS